MPRVNGNSPGLPISGRRLPPSTSSGPYTGLTEMPDSSTTSRIFSGICSSLSAFEKSGLRLFGVQTRSVPILSEVSRLRTPLSELRKAPHFTRPFDHPVRAALQEHEHPQRGIRVGCTAGFFVHRD